MRFETAHLDLLLAQAQKVGQLRTLAVNQQVTHGRKHPATRQAWVIYYAAVRKSERMRSEFLKRMEGAGDE